MKILLLAGEESGVLYARRLQESLRAAAAAWGHAALPGGSRSVATVGGEIEFRGYETEGFKTGDLAVMGFWPVLRRLGYFLGVAKTMKGVIARWRPDVVVTIDYPGLNLKLAAYAKSLGIPAVHIVCPQVWAWHQNRIPKIAAALTKLLCFFPFEPALFAKTGLDAKFIGHPLVDVFTEEEKECAAAWGHAALPDTPDKVATAPSPSCAEGRLLAVLPGSRLGEIRRHLPRLLKALELISPVRRSLGEGGAPLRVGIPAANAKAEQEIGNWLTEAKLAELKALGVEVAVQRGGARELLRQASCAVVASGTATLEAALARCPTALVYAVSPLLAWFARRVIKDIHYIGLANVIWEKSGGEGEAPMPEYLQEAFTPEAVAAKLGEWLGDETVRLAAKRRLDEAMALLHSDGDALGLAAREIVAAVRA